MKNIMFALLLCVSFTWPAFSQIYKWKDKDGNIIISSTPPPPSVISEKKEVEKAQPKPKTTAAAETDPGTQDFGFRRPYRDVKVLMYMTDWCGYCRKARALFKSLGVRLTEYNIENDPQKEKEQLRKSGGAKGVPLLDIEGTIVRGFDEEEIRAAIERRRAI